MITLERSKHKIKYIIHMSDIHIRNDIRETEYRECFDETYLRLKPLCINNDTIIVIVGDLLHNGRLCSPIAFNLINDFIHNLSLIAPTFIIPGNHDRNSTKKDFLTLIYEWSQYDNWYLLNNSGAYQFRNIIFGVTDVLDKKIFPASEIDQDADYKIALYHGYIIDPDTKELMINKFDGYDYILLGDIHSFQYVDEDRTAAYCGSLIEQNFKECHNEHGFIRWDLEKHKSEFIPVSNNYGHRILDIIDGEVDIDDLPQHLSIRYTLTNTSPVQLDRIMDKIRKRGCIIHEFVEERPMNGEKATGKKMRHADVTALESQIKQIKSYLSDCAVDKEEMNTLINIHRKIYAEIPETEPKRNGTWKLLELKFENMLSYGRGNIDFSKYSAEDIIGLNGKNQYGKSAVIEILLFCLFEKYSKSKNIVDIMNKSENACKCSVKIQIGDIQYYIKRVGQLHNTKFNVAVTFHKYVNDKWEDLGEGIGKVQLCKDIQSRVGKYEDFIVTFFYCQRQDLNLINMTNMQRIKYLLSILGLDIFEEYFVASKKIIAGINTKMSEIDGMMTEILRECRDVRTLRSKIKMVTVQIAKISAKKDKIKFVEINKSASMTAIMRDIEDNCNKRIEFNKYCAEIDALKAELARCKKGYVAYEGYVAKREKLFLKLESYQKYNNMMHHSRLPYELMIAYLPKMSECINDFLSKFDSFRVAIEYESNIMVSNTGKYVVSGTGSNIGLFIEKGDNSINLTTVTGFGRFIASMAIKYGMGMVMKNVRPGVTFIDEGWDCLDHQNLKNVGPMLARLKVLYGCVVVISHLPEIQEVMTKVVEVKRRGDRSYIDK